MTWMLSLPGHQRRKLRHCLVELALGVATVGDVFQRVLDDLAVLGEVRCGWPRLAPLLEFAVEGALRRLLEFRQFRVNALQRRKAAVLVVVILGHGSGA